MGFPVSTVYNCSVCKENFTLKNLLEDFEIDFYLAYYSTYQLSRLKAENSFTSFSKAFFSGNIL